MFGEGELMEQNMTILNFLCRTKQQAFTGASECLARLHFPFDKLQIVAFFFSWLLSPGFVYMLRDQRLHVELINW